MKLRLVAALFFALLLNGCGGSSPSEKVLRNLALNEFEQMAPFAAFAYSPEQMALRKETVSTLKLVSCEKIGRRRGLWAVYGDEIFACDIQLKNPKGKETKNLTVVVANLDDQWVAPKGMIP